MDKNLIASVEDFIQMEGRSLGTSSWMLIDQDMINRFADATMDNQWIHIDNERAMRDSMYHSTIAHGYLTLSLIIHLLEDTFVLQNAQQIINYGIDKFTFQNPVLVDSRIRLHVFLKSAKDLGSACMAKLFCQMEIENQEKPAFEGIITLIYNFV